MDVSYCIREVRQWMALRMLKLNDDNTEIIFFTSKHNLKLYGVCSMSTDGVRNLGVHMDQHDTSCDSCVCCLTIICTDCHQYVTILQQKPPKVL